MDVEEEVGTGMEEVDTGMEEVDMEEEVDTGMEEVDMEDADVDVDMDASFFPILPSLFPQVFDSRRPGSPSGRIRVVVLHSSDSDEVTSWGTKLKQHRIDPVMVRNLTAILYSSSSEDRIVLVGKSGGARWQGMSECPTVCVNEWSNASAGRGSYFCNGVDVRWPEAVPEKVDVIQAGFHELLRATLEKPGREGEGEGEGWVESLGRGHGTASEPLPALLARSNRAGQWPCLWRRLDAGHGVLQASLLLERRQARALSGAGVKAGVSGRGDGDGDDDDDDDDDGDGDGDGDGDDNDDDNDNDNDNDNDKPRDSALRVLCAQIHL